MIQAVAIILSLISLSGSVYAVLHSGPGPKGDVGPRGEKGDSGQVVETNSRIRPIVNSGSRKGFMTQNEKREEIADSVNDSDFLKSVSEIRKNRSETSGLIAPDPDAQLNQRKFRKRNLR